MWVENGKLVTQKYYIRSHINSNITEIKGVKDKITDSISIVNNSIANIASGIDKTIIGEFERGMDLLNRAQQTLEQCLALVDKFETRELIEDDDTVQY